MQQLPGADSIFLAMETPTLFMHTGALTILDPAGSPGLGFQRLKEIVAERIVHAPRFTLKLREVPFGLDRPFLVEDPDFDVARHLHRVGCPSPGGPRELAELVGEIAGRALDRRHPLWEMWFIEGLEGGRVATVMKTHHCLVDGISGAGLGEILCDLQPNPPPRPREPRKPRPRREREPSDLVLAARGAWRSLFTPLGLARLSGQALRRVPVLASYWREDDVPSPLGHAPRLPFNAEIGPRRAFAYTAVRLSEVKEVRKHFDVKLNDVVVAICAGALRRYLEATDALPEKSLITAMPISTRAAGDTQLGNQVSTIFVSMHTDVDDPAERLRAIHATTMKAKEMAQALRVGEIMAMGDTAPPALLNLAFRGMLRMQSVAPLPTNTIVSNVPGPPFPLYMAGARVVANYPIAPITPGMGLNITVMSYCDSIDFGVVVDPDLVPEPWAVVEGIPLALAELRRAAGIGGTENG
jgi:WS/DGAT/MGAT family acyltransferase